MTTTKPRRYYTLAVRFEASDEWSVQFGDYDRECVVQEKEDAYEDAYAAKVISSNDDQAAINAAIAKLNAK